MHFGSKVALVDFVRDLLLFSSTNVVRHQMLFQRALPGLELVTHTPGLSPDIVERTRIAPVTGSEVGARLKEISHAGRGPDWPNKPPVITARRGRAFAFARTERFAGTMEWRYRFLPEGTRTAAPTCMPA